MFRKLKTVVYAWLFPWVVIYFNHDGDKPVFGAISGKRHRTYQEAVAYMRSEAPLFKDDGTKWTAEIANGVTEYDMG